MQAKLRQEIVFIGSSSIGLKRLIENKSFIVSDVLCLKGRLNEELINISNKNGFTIKNFEWINAFREIIIQYPKTTPFFIYQLDMLVPKDLTEQYSFYNIHRGNLYTNRGPSPDIWPILNSDKETSISLHKINEKIDAGILIDAYDVKIIEDDDTITIKKKLEAGLPQLIKSLKKYMNGEIKGEILNQGIYRPWITAHDFTINIDVDTIETIKRKIRCQSQYNGAILFINNEKYYITDILKIEKSTNNGSNPFLEKESEIKVKKGIDLITFKLNMNPKYPPLPVHPESKRI